ncbi:MAG: hypothetical protein CM1200mP41_36090 [Gammaproteobacteria bacterium]|nr:MAG: hypothetical protein CM1200mP41_36090 [Gammaproteobacteria bacterium]
MRQILIHPVWGIDGAGFFGGQSSVVGDLQGMPRLLRILQWEPRASLDFDERMRGARFIRARPLYRPH